MQTTSNPHHYYHHIPTSAKQPTNISCCEEQNKSINKQRPTKHRALWRKHWVGDAALDVAVIASDTMGGDKGNQNNSQESNPNQQEQAKQRGRTSWTCSGNSAISHWIDENKPD